MAQKEIKNYINKTFYDELEKELFIRDFGYNDFNYIEPQKYPSVRDKYVLHYVFSGEGVMFVDGKTFNVKGKQFFMVPKGYSVMYYPNPDNKWRYAWFSIEGELDDLFVEKMGFSVSSPVKNAPPSFNEMPIYDIACEYDENRPVSYYTVKSAFYACLGALNEPQKCVTPIMSIVSQAKKIIEMNYTDGDFNIDSIANALNVSHSYLSKVFKKVTEETLASHLIAVRLSKAGELLLKTTLSAKEIAFSVGYNDEIHFFKEFKKFFGKTTKEYRNSAQE